ncbi:hypothetical protein [Flavobacterium sp.]|uniref:hypothetical protein n=1 Tax=Flavobacterium sp. TaxID=239 RepID=UPI00260C231F|nr:hypothetical protein [Flavobacterium sp.]MDD2986145.1 hypothetical protein [Flavobacterium sp.]
MKGVIIKYFSDRGYGYILGEDDNSYYFHISKFKNRNEFKENFQEYYRHRFDDTCYQINFLPSTSDQGLCAININLTDEKINDRESKEIFDAKIAEIKNEIHTVSRTVSGIKKGESAPIFATAGGNGTYRLGYPETFRNLYLYFSREDKQGWGLIEVRDLFLEVNERSKITTKSIESLKGNLLNKTIQITSNGKEWVLVDEKVLKI